MNDRRSFLALAGAGALLAACKDAHSPKGGDDDEEVSAVEDLMREHGVIRRALVVYRESATRLRANPASVPPEQLQKTALLFRSFAEDYHERLLEEAHLFPAIKKAGGPAAAEVDILLVQHQRGREITDVVLALTKSSLGANAESLAKTLEDFARMYDAHAAREDTVIFPAWKKTMSPKQLDEMGERFEEIEHKTFGGDGFDIAVAQIDAIEKALGIDLASLTPPPLKV